MLTDSLTGSLEVGQATTHSTGLLLTEILGSVLLASVLLLQLAAALNAQDSEDAGDSLADMAAIKNIRLKSKMDKRYIKATLLALPEETFWTRRAESSFFKSASCLVNSALDLFLSSKALTLVD